jgi:hypothetical protein
MFFCISDQRLAPCVCVCVCVGGGGGGWLHIYSSPPLSLSGCLSTHYFVACLIVQLLVPLCVCVILSRYSFPEYVLCPATRPPLWVSSCPDTHFLNMSLSVCVILSSYSFPEYVICPATRPPLCVSSCPDTHFLNMAYVQLLVPLCVCHPVQIPIS